LHGEPAGGQLLNIILVCHSQLFISVNWTRSVSLLGIGRWNVWFLFHSFSTRDIMQDLFLYLSFFSV